jgi:hypothetical protein
MDTRRIAATNQALLAAPERRLETIPFDTVELVEVRYIVMPRGRAGFGALVPALVLTAILATIALLAVATQSGWSVLGS